MHYPVLVATKSVEPNLMMEEIERLLGPYSEEGVVGESSYSFVCDDSGDACDPDTGECGWWSNDDCEFDYWDVEEDLWSDVLAVTDEGGIILPVTYLYKDPVPCHTWATSALVDSVAPETWERDLPLVVPGSGWSDADPTRLEGSGARALTVVDCHI